jgi:hypothetical protein
MQIYTDNMNVLWELGSGYIDRIIREMVGSLFNDASNSSDCIPRMVGWLMNDELEIKWKEVVVA